MKIQQFILGLSILTLIGCTKVMHVTNSEAQSYKLSNEEVAADKAVDDLIKPYRTKLDEVMNEVIGYSETDLYKTQPEGTLNNWMADVIQFQSKKHFKKNVDCTILNYGGIRIPSITKGDITRSKIFELMPFDNEIVLMSMDKKTLTELLNMVAINGGWPISKELKMTISNGVATDVMINEKPLADKTYQVALPDYIANGGDKCFFLADKDRIRLGVLVRDALLEHVEEMTEKGEKINVVKDGRISIDN